MSKENPADYGSPKTELPLKNLADQPLKKDVKAGKVLTADSETKLSTETPDPNVTSVGGTADTVTSGTVTGDANTTRSTTRTSRSTSTTDGT
jgi:hypothetical protein